MKRGSLLILAVWLCTSFLASPAHATCGAESCPLVRDGRILQLVGAMATGMLQSRPSRLRRVSGVPTSRITRWRSFRSRRSLTLRSSVVSVMAPPSI